MPELANITIAAGARTRAEEFSDYAKKLWQLSREDKFEDFLDVLSDFSIDSYKRGTKQIKRKAYKVTKPQ